MTLIEVNILGVRAVSRYVGLLCLTLLFAVVPLAEAAMAQSRSTCVAPKLRQKMNYEAARSIILRSGFQAPAPPAYGYSKDNPKVISECSGDVDLCNSYPEIESCSGQGWCRLEFMDAYRNKLIVITYGELGKKANFPAHVTSFEIECKK